MMLKPIAHTTANFSNGCDYQYVDHPLLPTHNEGRPTKNCLKMLDLHQKNLAHNLKRIRSEQGLSQERLAELADVHRTYITFLENGEKNLTLHTLTKLAEALNVEVVDLLKEPR